MLIGELAARAGVTPKAVRYYEQRGFVKARRTASGYRDFEDGSLDVIQTIRSAQQLGVKLSELDEIVALVRDRKRPCTNVRSIISAKRREIAERIASLVEFDKFLVRLEDVDENGDGPCPILLTARRKDA